MDEADLLVKLRPARDRKMLEDALRNRSAREVVRRLSPGAARNTLHWADGVASRRASHKRDLCERKHRVRGPTVSGARTKLGSRWLRYRHREPRTSRDARRPRRIRQPRGASRLEEPSWYRQLHPQRRSWPQ